MSKIPINLPRPTAAQIAAASGSNKVWPTVTDIAGIAGALSLPNTSKYSPLVKDPSISAGTTSYGEVKTVTISSGGIVFPSESVVGILRVSLQSAVTSGTTGSKIFLTSLSIGGISIGTVLSVTTTSAQTVGNFVSICAVINSDGTATIFVQGVSSAQQVTGTIDLNNPVDIVITQSQLSGTAPSSWKSVAVVEWEPSREPY